MFKKYLLQPLTETPGGGSGGGTVNVGSQSSGVATTGNVTSGTATEAMIKAAMAASSAEPAPAGKPAGDTTVAAGSGEPGAKPSASGQPPQDGKQQPTPGSDRNPQLEERFKSVASNARTKTLSLVAEHLGLDPKVFSSQEAVADLKGLISVGLHMQKDVVAFYKQMGEELRQRGMLDDGDLVSGGRQEGWPDADVQSPDGKIKAYSDKLVVSMLKGLENRLRREFSSQLQPLNQFRETVTTEQQTNAALEEAREKKDAILTRSRALPHFKENEPAIAQKLATMDPEERTRLGPEAALYAAYHGVLNEKVWPSINQTAEQKVRDENARKANASHGVHPVSTSGDGKPAKLDNVNDLTKHMEHLAEVGVAGRF